MPSILAALLVLYFSAGPAHSDERDDQVLRLESKLGCSLVEDPPQHSRRAPGGIVEHSDPKIFGFWCSTHSGEKTFDDQPIVDYRFVVSVLSADHPWRLCPAVVTQYPFSPGELWFVDSLTSEELGDFPESLSEFQGTGWRTGRPSKQGPKRSVLEMPAIRGDELVIVCWSGDWYATESH